MPLQLQHPLVQFLLHSLAWGGVFFFPLLVFMDNEHFQQHYYVKSLLSLGFYLGIFYLNYFYLVNKQLFARRYISYIIVNALLVLVSAFIIQYFYGEYMHKHHLSLLKPTFSNNGDPTPKRIKFPQEFFYFREALMLVFTLGTAIAIRAMQRLGEQEKRFKAIENERLKTELTYLKYQMQPHFFFNTLNNIYALMDIAPEKAKETILRLSKLMRYVLYKSDAATVPLSEEIAFLKSYVELMRLRYADHVTIHINFPQQIDKRQVPPLLIMPLLENAFKHGIDATQKSFVELEWKENHQDLELTIRNSFFPKPPSDKSGSGIGLDNLRKRLDLLLSQEQYLFEQRQEGDIFITNLIVKNLYG